MLTPTNPAGLQPTCPEMLNTRAGGVVARQSDALCELTCRTAALQGAETNPEVGWRVLPTV